MKYISTRDDSSKKKLYTFEEAVCSGYAPDGGLYVPECGCDLPQVSADVLKNEWSKLTYPELAYTVLRMFISHDEVSNDQLRSICDSSYTGFLHPNHAVPVVSVGKTLLVSELFHGPTMCFKDLGMRVVVNFLSHFANQRERNTTLLVSTTGDTGPAAVQAVSDISNPRLTLLVHFPYNQISAFQRKQLTTVHSPYVHVASFEGGGDDMDLPIKRMLSLNNKNKTSSGSKGERHMCGVNSYNIGRPLTQMVHFIWTYLRVIEIRNLDTADQGSKVDIILPTGAMGNIVGGYMAKKMGVPIGMLCAAVNINDITHRAFQTGLFHKSKQMEKTLSDAINIQVPYNFERLLFYLTNGNCSLVKEWMTCMDKTHKLDLNDEWLKILRSEFHSARATDDEMCKTIQKVEKELDYFLDPHTAVAISAAEQLGYPVFPLNDQPEHLLQNANKNFVIMATASPCKFEESVTIALGRDGWNKFCETQLPQRAKNILSREEITPTRYNWEEGKSLEENQVLWEEIARDIIEKKFM